MAANDASETIIQEMNAGNLTPQQIASIESDVFGVPNFADVNINISDEEIQHINYDESCNDTTKKSTKMFLHTGEVVTLAVSYSNKCDTIT